jgi:hypothetical protein
MNNMNRLRIRYFLASMMAAVLGYGSPAIAADPSGPPDFKLDYPAGLACNFELSVDGWNGKEHINEFKDKNGVVRSLSAGTGAALRFTNVATGQTFSTKSNGAVQHTTTYTQDGSYTVSATGHTVLILFPTDVPAGPSTTLYVGQIVYSSDSTNNFTLLKESKNKTDICAALS